MRNHIILPLGAGLVLLGYAAQAQVLTPLHRFFQQNFDSTIIYQSSSSLNNSPNYLILAKYQGRLAFFTYLSPYRNALGQYFPGKLSQKFSAEEYRFRATVPDTNRYLVPKLVASETLSRSWRLLNPRRLWAVQGDQQASKPANTCVMEDGEENTFYLITKKAIRVVGFYAPDFYEKCAGPDPNRQRAITARNTLRTLLLRAAQ